MIGAHLPALARPLRGGGSRRSLRPPPGPPTRRGARRWTRWRGCWSSAPRDPRQRPSARRKHLATPKPVADHGAKRSYNLQSLMASPSDAGARRPGVGRSTGASGWSCPARHAVSPDRATSGSPVMVGPERHHGRCAAIWLPPPSVAEEGTMSSFGGGVRGDPGQWACSARSTPTAPATEHASDRRQGGRTPRDLPGTAAPWRSSAGILELIHAAYSPEARGRSERMLRHLAEAPAPATQAHPACTDMVEATASKEVFLPQHNAQPFAPRPRTGAPPGVPDSPARSTTSCASTRNAPSQTTTRCRYKRLALHDPAGHRRHYQGQGPRPSIPRRHNGRLPFVWRDDADPNRRQPNPRGRVTRRRDRPAPCGQVDSRDPRPTTSSQDQKLRQKRSNSMVVKPVLKFLTVGRTSVSGRCAGRGGMDHRAISGRERRFLAVE